MLTKGTKNRALSYPKGRICGTCVLKFDRPQPENSPFTCKQILHLQPFSRASALISAKFKTQMQTGENDFKSCEQTVIRVIRKQIRVHWQKQNFIL